MDVIFTVSRLLPATLWLEREGHVQADVHGNSVLEDRALPVLSRAQARDRDLRLVGGYPQGREEACELQRLVEGEEPPPEILRRLEVLQDPPDQAGLASPAWVVEDLDDVDPEDGTRPGNLAELHRLLPEGVVLLQDGVGEGDRESSYQQVSWSIIAATQSRLLRFSSLKSTFNYIASQDDGSGHVREGEDRVRAPREDAEDLSLHAQAGQAGRGQGGSAGPSGSRAPAWHSTTWRRWSGSG